MFHVRDLCAVFAFVGVVLCVQAQEPAAIKGFVFEDLNKNGVKDAGEPGLTGVAVSDQKTIVQTAQDGSYMLPGSENVTVFVNTPADYEAAPDSYTGVPQFFKNIHVKDKGLFKATGPMPASVDFGLNKRANAGTKKFTAAIMGDTQMGDMNPEFSADIVDELMGRDALDFVMVLGDITGEKFDLFREIPHMLYRTGAPFYGVIGNHDRDYAAEEFDQSSASYKKVYGPDYYSFDRGDAHFMVLNSIFYTGKGSSYKHGYNQVQLDWVKQDLAMVPKNKAIYICAHAPLGFDPEENRKEFLVMFEDREAPITLMAGHMHATYGLKLTPKEDWHGKQPFTVAVMPHACGAWWIGPQDERGLNQSDQMDGTPNGYGICNFDGTSFTMDFKPSAHSETFQSRIYTPNQRVIAFNPNKLPKDTILVNAFCTFLNADVQYSLDGGEWKSMEKVSGIKDPHMEYLMNSPKSNANTWLPNDASPHLWKTQVGKLSSGKHYVRVRFPGIDGRMINQSKTFIMP